MTIPIGDMQHRTKYVLFCNIEPSDFGSRLKILS